MRKRRRPKAVTILGRRWRLVLDEALRDVRGTCDPPRWPHRAIRIDRRLEDPERLEVLLHEFLHAAAWDVFDEEFVTRLAYDLARELHRLGYHTDERN